jgi:ABC-2 type transport system ATP-binding protein
MNERPLAVVIKELYKSFKLPHEQHSGLKQLIVDFAKRKRGFEKQHVLDNVSFEIKQGDFFGIVGRNGSGKSTLLKLLAGIYAPDKGLVQVNGSLTPFIELGVGFNPELTGRENIFLNGALLGFNRKEVAAMYDDIVGFAELERFMDQKLKNYSSGMQVRLAFSIAIQAKSDILLLDEVLAVGDEAFQKKCINIFEKYKASKQTIILVTHDMGVVERFCTRALMLEDGKVIQIGSPSKVARLYTQANEDDYAETKVQEEEKKHYPGVHIRVLDNDYKPTQQFKSGDEALVEVTWEDDKVKHAGVALMRESGEYVFGPNTYRDKYQLTSEKKIIYRVKLNLNSGDYFFKIGLFGAKDDKVLAFIDRGPSIIISSPKTIWGGITSLEHSWEQ